MKDNIMLIGSIITIIGIIFNAIWAIFTFRYRKKKDSNKNDKLIIECLRKEIMNLSNKLKVYSEVKSADDGDYYILISDNRKICPICWSDKSIAIPIFEHGNSGEYICDKCKKYGIFNKSKYESLKHSKSNKSSYSKTFSKW